MTALRVAHVCATAGASGVEAHLLALLPSFDPARVRPVMIAPGPGPLVTRLEAAGVPVEMGAPTRKLAFVEAQALGERLRGRFDVLHAHGPRATFWTARAARRAAIPLVATVHELRWRTLPRGLKREAWIALEARALAGAQRVITVSNAARDELLARWPQLADRLRVVHASAPALLHAADLSQARPGARDGGPMRLVTVGRFDAAKGYDRLLQALRVLVERRVPFTLDIVGHGVLEDAIRAETGRLGLAEHVRWHTRDTDVPALLAGAHAFVSATRSETFGIAVLEAMACGLPVIAPAVGSLPELVRDGVDGVLVPDAPDDGWPQRLSDRLVACWNDPATMTAMGVAGASRAREAFSPGVFAAATEAVYRELSTP